MSAAHDFGKKQTRHIFQTNTARHQAHPAPTSKLAQIVDQNDDHHARYICFNEIQRGGHLVCLFLRYGRRCDIRLPTQLREVFGHLGAAQRLENTLVTSGAVHLGHVAQFTFAMVRECVRQ